MYDIAKSRALETFLGRWVPVPFFKIEPGKDSSGNEIYAQGPTDWVPVRVTETRNVHGDQKERTGQSSHSTARSRPGRRTVPTSRPVRRRDADRIVPVRQPAPRRHLVPVPQPGGVRPANAQSAQELFRYPQTLLNGTVSATVGVPLESCREFCSARSGCIGFDYASPDRVCRLFASVGGASQNQQWHPQSSHVLASGLHQFQCAVRNYLSLSGIKPIFGGRRRARAKA